MSDVVFETRRKALHLALTGFPFPMLWAGLDRSSVAIFALALAVLFVLSEYLRLYRNVRNTPSGLLVRLMSRRLRDDPNHPSWREFRYPYWLVGIAVAALLFSDKFFLAGVAVLALGDLAAALVGKAFGKTRIRGEKTAEGALACLLVSLTAIYAITNDWGSALGGAVVGTVAEVVSGKLDNLTITPSAAAAAQYLRPFL